MFSVHTWSQVYDFLKAEGFELHIFSQQQLAQEALALLEDGAVDIFIGQLFRDLPWHDELVSGSEKAKHRIGIGWDTAPQFSSFTPAQCGRFETYMRGLSARNYFNGIKFLISCTGTDVVYDMPEPVRTHGVYHPDASSLFDSVAVYLDWQNERGYGGQDRPLAGLLCSYGQIVENNCAEVDALIRGLERHELTPLCIFCEGIVDGTVPADRRYPWLAYLQEAGTKVVVLLNLLIGRLVSSPEDISILEGFNVPVIQIIRSYLQSPDDWKADFGGLGTGSQNMVFSLTQPEMSGSIEPTLAAGTVPEIENRSGLSFRRYAPVEERIAELKKELGTRLSQSELQRMASFRVFSSAPGTYGTGVGLALDASAWETDEDLAETYINWSGYAYGSDRRGQFSRVSGMEAHKLYAGNLKTLNVTYMRQYSPDYDLVDCGRYTGSLGGMSVAAKAVSGKRARLYWADVNTQGDLSVRDLKEDIAAAVRTKLFNKHWIEHQKQHGYKGASGVSSRVHNLFKWSATTHEVDKWVFDSVVETYIQDRENLEWPRENNPYALEEVTRRLLEAHSRGLWEADPDLLKEVQEAALLIEGDMEEIIGEVREEFQGAKVDVMTSKDVEKWDYRWKIDRSRS